MPPDGVLYAGDINAIQDAAAALNDLLQTIYTGALAIGENGLQLLRYGAGEARLSGHLRVDGILRGLGGLYGGQFTSAQRDAIPVGSRPTGLIIFNTTNARHEFNVGTDAVPNWQHMALQGSGEVIRSMLASDVALDLMPVGAEIDWPYAESTIPTRWMVRDGRALSRTAYSALHTLAQASGYPHGAGDGVNTFNIEDCRGRGTVGKDDMGGIAAGRIGSANNGTTLGGVHGLESVVLAILHIPLHDHGGATQTAGLHSHGGATGTSTSGSYSHAHGGGTGGQTVFHSHSMNALNKTFANVGSSGAQGTMLADVTLTGGYEAGHISSEDTIHAHAITTDTHTHSVPALSISADGTHSHPITAQGGGSAHQNLQPGIVVNKILKVL